MSIAPPAPTDLDTSAEAPRPARKPSASPLRRAFVAVLTPLASLKLTVGLFALSMLLVFFGTIAQKDNGIWTVIDDYFWSNFVFVRGQLVVQFLQVFFQWPAEGTVLSDRVGFWLPGGKLLGGVMLLNLLAAHLVRFRAVQTYREIKQGFADGRGLRTLALVFAKRGGTWAIHSGLVLLFLGEAGTRVGQVEQKMRIFTGETANYAFHSRDSELAFVDRSKPDGDYVTVIPEVLLRHAAKNKTRLAVPGTPYEVLVEDFYPNSDLIGRTTDPRATAGYAVTERKKLVPAPEGAGVGSARVDTAGAYVTVFKDGAALGTYATSVLLGITETPPQKIEGGPFDLELRYARHYKPFTLTLTEFKQENYAGSGIPRGYSSLLRLVDAERGEDREVLIQMNEPLRHRGETFYQASFDSFSPVPRYTDLQVVRNPVWWVPYASCVLVTLGMLVHFGYYFVQFLTRIARGGVAPQASGHPTVPYVSPLPRPTALDWLAAGGLVVGLLVFYYGGIARQEPVARLNLGEVGSIPVLHEGRVKPLDTVARSVLRTINKAEQYTDGSVTPKKARPAIEWFMDLAAAPQGGGRVWPLQLIRIESQEVRDALELPRVESLRYSLAEITSGTPRGESRYGLLIRAAREAAEVRRVNPDALSHFQKAVLAVHEHVKLALDLHAGVEPLLVPGELDKGSQDFRPYAQWQRAYVDGTRRVILEAVQMPPQADDDEVMAAVNKLDTEAQSALRSRAARVAEQLTRDDPAAAAWKQVLSAYNSKKQSELDKAVAEFRRLQDDYTAPSERAACAFEAKFNRLNPFFHLIFGCMGVGAVVAASWLTLLVNPSRAEAMRRAALYGLVALFAVQTVSLVSRMYLSDRWLVFVTNLYSSAVFIAWGAMLLGILIERVVPLGLGILLAAVLGGATNDLAHILAHGTGGDTIEQQRAVLNTTFWLGTHVTTIVFGYTATFAAGLVGVGYIALDLFTNVLKKQTVLGRGPTARKMEVGRVVGMVIYGMVCFAALLSFVGTVLGGIWADQSWGRFWGWDPKENGAVLIVIWNALILHARWGGMVKDRGVAALAVFGNAVTAWSYFGTNQLGVGLHAYGFSKDLADGCVAIWLSHLAVIAVAVGAWGTERLRGARA